MELVKKHIHMNRRRNSVMTQITLDDDFNVPDSMDDVEQMILDSGEIQIETVKHLGGRVTVGGKLNFRILYRRPDGQLMTLAGSIPFEEQINVPELEETDYVQAGGELDDLHVGLINSRKLNVKALVTLTVQAETIFDVEAAADVTYDGDVETLKREITAAAIAVRRKDTFRVRENLTLSANKPDIDHLLWQDIRLRGVDTKPLDGRIHIDGELMVFAVYSGEDGQMPVQCLEESIPFSGEVELAESLEGMIPFITVRLVHKDLEVSPDADGEMRELTADAVMELDIRLYEEQQTELLSDLYALDREIVLDTGEACFDTIAARNLVKTRIQEKLSLAGNQRILQICHCDGDLKLDEVQVKEDGLHIYGVLEVQLLYLTADDGAPVSAASEVLPFHMIAEVQGLKEDCIYQTAPGLEQISAVMLGGDAVELKAVISVDVLILQPVCEPVILEVREEPLDKEKLKNMPGIVGYVVQPGDTLWKLARTFHTSVEEIMETNHLTESRIDPGDRLILVKKIELEE